MGYWQEKEEYDEGKVKPIKSKCPANKKIEIVWKSEEMGSSVLICSFSGEKTCKRCIEKGKYPEEDSFK